jgi:uncharacterized membrane protein YqaE (UPF0057 family)
VNRYLKLIAQLVATVLAALVAALYDGAITTDEWINVLLLGLGALAVLGAGELPAGVWAHTKTIVSAATAGAVFLQSAVTGGLSGAEWLQLVLAVLATFGVGAVSGPVVDQRDRRAA